MLLGYLRFSFRSKTQFQYSKIPFGVFGLLH